MSVSKKFVREMDMMFHQVEVGDRDLTPQAGEGPDPHPRAHKKGEDFAGEPDPKDLQQQVKDEVEHEEDVALMLNIKKPMQKTSDVQKDHAQTGKPFIPKHLRGIVRGYS